MPDTPLAQLFGFDNHQALAEAVHAWGALRQDSMRATLDQGSEALHRKLREILGLSALAEFESATRETAQELKERATATRADLDGLQARLRSAQTELQAAQEQQSTRQAALAAVAARLERLRAQAVAGVRVSLPANAKASDIQKVADQVAVLARAALELAQQLAASPQVENAPTETEVAELARGAEDAELQLADTQERHSAQVRMAEAALMLLSAHCPVCEQQINEASVRESLLSRMEGEDGSAGELEVARERLSASRAALESAQVSHRRAVAMAQSQSAAANRWLQMLKEASLVDVPPEWHDLVALSTAHSGLQNARDELQGTYRELLALEHDPAVAGLVAQVSELKTAEADAREKAEDAARRAQQADALRKAATASAVDITELSLKALEPSFAEVYDRLSPHPSFTSLTMVHETYYGKGRSAPRILDPVRNIQANPNLVCSEGQLNIVALARSPVGR